MCVVLAVSFSALQYDLFPVVSFIIVYYWQCCLFVCNVRYVRQCHLSLYRYVGSGSAICCFVVMLAVSSVLLCNVAMSGSVVWCCAI